MMTSSSIHKTPGDPISVTGDESGRLMDPTGESQEFLCQLLDALPLSLCYLDSQQRYRFVNKAYEAQWGLLREEAQGRHVRDVIGNQLYTAIEAHIEAALAGTRVTYETSIPCADARERHEQLTFTPDVGEWGGVRGLSMLSTDITERKRHEEALRRRIREMTALNALNEHVSTNLPLDQMVRASLDGIESAIGPDLSLFFLREDDSLILQGYRSSDARFRHDTKSVHRVGECLCGLAASEKRPIYSKDIRRDKRCTWPECKKAGVRSFAALPLLSGDEVLGVLALASWTRRDFEEQTAFLATLSHELAVGLQNSVLYEQVRRQTDELRVANTRLSFEVLERKRSEEALAWELRVRTALADLSHSLISPDGGLATVASQVLEYAKSLTDSAHGYVSEIDPATGDGIVHTVTERVRTQRAASEEKETIVFPRRPDGEYPALWGRRLDARDPCYTNHPQTYKGSIGTPEGHITIESFLSAPVLLGEQLLGQIALANSDDGYTERDLTAVQQLAELYALAIYRHRAESERARLEEQLQQAQKMEAIGTLAGGIAHDFNNILTPIMAHADLMLLKQPEDSPVRENVEQILLAAERASELVRQILAFSRREEQERRPVEMQLLVREAVKLLRASIPTTIDIRVDIDPGSGSVLANPSQMHQVLMNLCTNARQAMGDKDGVLYVSVDRVVVAGRDRTAPAELPDGTYVRIAVRDTGHGMDSETKERIFEPYFTTKGDGEGTGLGLPVVHGIVTGLGGAITVESEVGKGSTFEIYLPSIAREASAARSEISALPRGTERVLLVDDELSNVRIGEKMLTTLGYRVVAYTSSLEALQRFRADPAAFDVVLTDQTLPHLTGAELTRQILAVRPDLPVILCTGYSDVLDEERAAEIGAKALIMKPFSLKSLAIAVRSALDATQEVVRK